MYIKQYQVEEMGRRGNILLTCLFVLALSRHGKSAADPLTMAVVTALIGIGNEALDSISENTFENEAMYCIWNDWESRDQRARINKTFKNGRWSQQKRTLGAPNGRWYCTYMQKALKALGQPLD